MVGRALSSGQISKLCELDLHANKREMGGIASPVQRLIRHLEGRLKRVRTPDVLTTQPLREQVLQWALAHRISGDLNVDFDSYPKLFELPTYMKHAGSSLGLIDRRGLSLIRRWENIGLTEFPVWRGDALVTRGLEEAHKTPKMYWFAASNITPVQEQGLCRSYFPEGTRGPTIEEALTLASVLGYWRPEQARTEVAVASYLQDQPWAVARWKPDEFGVPYLHLDVGALGELRDVRHFQIQILSQMDSGRSCG